MAVRPSKRSFPGGLDRRAIKRQANQPEAFSVEDLRRYQTELETQNEALRFSQSAAELAYERFVTLFSNVPLALMVIDDRGQILQNNARALALLRPKETDAELTYILPFIAKKKDVAQVQKAFVQARDCGACELAEIVFKAGLDRQLVGDLHIARLEKSVDGGLQFICAIVDQSALTAQRNALQASAETLQQRNTQLTQSRSRLAAIIDASLDAIISIDATQHVSVFNPAAQALFGYTPEQVLGQAVSMLLPELDGALMQTDAQVPGRLGAMTARNCRGDKVDVEVSLSVEHHPDGDRATLFVHDLTAKNKMEAHRAALELQLRESQKMQAIGTLAGGIAHDFNNIIGAILGNVSLARQDTPDNVSTTTSLLEIERAARRARDLVRQILTFSRNERPHQVTLALADVVQETLRLFKVSLPPNVTLSSQIDEQSPPVLADPTQIEQVLLNLLTNAMHAIGQQSGQISVVLTSGEGWPDALAAASEQPVVLRVSDTGCGMDKATQERIFEPFFTTKPVGQGTGLGLSVVHGILQAHGGAIHVKSQPTRGSIFSVYLPTTSLPVPDVLGLVPSTETPNGGGQRVMVVDDDDAQLFLVKRLLSRRGYQVIAFSDPKQALQALTNMPDQCDVLVTDFNMPGFSGIDLLRAVRTIRPDLPMALASGFVTPDIEREALAAGARKLIHKPNDVEELCQALACLLGRAAA